MALSPQQAQLCADNTIDFSNLSALFINTSLKRAGGKSHTRLLLGVSGDMMVSAGVSMDHLHIPDHAIPPGV